MMCRLAYIVFLLFFCEELFAVKDMSQSGATIKYCDPAYVTNCKAITKRTSRLGPYRTNITGTSLQPWHNNVTLRVETEVNGYSHTFTVKMCEVKSMKWLTEYVTEFSNFPTTVCPIPPMQFNLWNLEFPPKNLPWLVPVDEMNLKFIMEFTETGKRIAECDMHLRK